MKERVSVRIGTSNILLICPHGHDLDDTNTNVLTLEMAKALDCCAVVNNGWRRSQTVDALLSLANCNDIHHCREAVVKDEFLDPIVSHINNRGFDPDEPVHCFLIHGIGNSVRKKANDPALDIIVGFGNGHQPRYTCELWRKDLYVDLLNQGGYKTYEGAAGGAYSARSGSNMTQAVHRIAHKAVDCFQLEFIYELRKDNKIAAKVAQDMAQIIKDWSNFTTYTRKSGTPVYEI